MAKPMIDLDAVVAPPGVAPKAYQTKCPDHARDGGNKVPVGASQDLTRILALPRRPVPSTVDAQRTIDTVMDHFQLRRANPACECRAKFKRDCILSLNLIQAWSLVEMHTQDGLLGAIGVGHGKTILDLLAPMVLRGAATVCLLVPVKNMRGLLHDWELVGQHFHMPSIVMHDSTNVSRIIPGRPVLHVLPYSRLQQPTASEYLQNNIKPDAIVADECHKLKRAQCATTGRVLRYFRDNPKTKFCGWSGSLTDKSIKEYSHLAALALRHGSPLPIVQEVVDDWARALDPPALGAVNCPEGALIALCEPGEHVRSGFRRRLTETPGVVSTSVAAVSARLEILEHKPPPMPASVEAALTALRNDWVRPDGAEFADALQRHACALQLACGFFYRHRFPPIKGVPQKVTDILSWQDARRDWCSEVRHAIRNRKEHFDSEALARNAAERAWGHRPVAAGNKLPVWKASSFPRWRELEHTVAHVPETVWIDDWLARDVANWARDNRGIVWYSQAAFGVRVAEISGLALHTGGPEAEQLIERFVKSDDPTPASIICSLGSHGTGRDGLQFKFDDQLVANFPSSNQECEQFLGRLHRFGQKADTVRCRFLRHTPEVNRATNQALRRAGYVESTWGQAQKLNLGGVEALDEEEEE